MTGIEWTADQVEAMFHAALKARDTKGVEAAIRVLLGIDARRAIELWDTLGLAVGIAHLHRGTAV